MLSILNYNNTNLNVDDLFINNKGRSLSVKS